MKIEILGTGCAKCDSLEAEARAVADKLGLTYELVHVKDITKIMSYGVMLTPALAVDGEVKVAGKVPGEKELTKILAAAASR